MFVTFQVHDGSETLLSSWYCEIDDTVTSLLNPNVFFVCFFFISARVNPNTASKLIKLSVHCQFKVVTEITFLFPPPVSLSSPSHATFAQAFPEEKEGATFGEKTKDRYNVFKLSAEYF